MILQFEDPLFILITFIKSPCIFVLKKLHFGVFMGEMLSPLYLFLCQLICQSADIMSSLCGMGVRVNNFFSKTARPRDMLFF